MCAQTNAKKGDPNFNIITTSKEGMVFKNVLDIPEILITGYPFMEENNNWHRLPNRIMPALPEQLQWVAAQPSGGMLHFRTDSRQFSIKVELERNEVSGQCSQNSLSGFDVYVNSGNGNGYEFRQNLNVDGNPMEYTADLAGDLPGGVCELKLYAPLQNPVGNVYIGIDEGASIYAPTPFDVSKPVLFYGSSITCGFCCSRPGLSYPAQITRALNAEMINFGFGGGALGEKEVAEAIASLDMSCFVYDYDCNAPTPEFLWDTHENFFRIIREAQPDLPIIIVSGVFYWKNDEFNEKRREAIEATYLHATAAGDKNVAFIDGGKLFPQDSWFDCTTDCLHPNDLGFMYMRNAIEPVVRHMLLKR